MSTGVSLAYKYVGDTFVSVGSEKLQLQIYMCKSVTNIKQK